MLLGYWSKDHRSVLSMPQLLLGDSVVLALVAMFANFTSLLRPKFGYAILSKLLRRTALRAVFLLLSLVVSFTPAFSDETTSREQKIKAALIYYIAKFVEWPLSSSKLSIQVCVQASQGMFAEVQDTLRGKVIGSRPIDIQKFADSESLYSSTTCNLVFFDRAELLANPSLPEKLKGRSILTVCEVERPEWGSCVIQIFEQDNKARLAIDTALATSAKLKISSELLELALVKS